MVRLNDTSMYKNMNARDVLDYEDDEDDKRYMQKLRNDDSERRRANALKNSKRENSCGKFEK